MNGLVTTSNPYILYMGDDIYIIPNNAGNVKSNLKEFEENKYKVLILDINI